jgi:hypothetical protein
MAKADRVLNFFPAFIRAKDRTKLLAQVIAALVAPLEEADTLLFRIQRAHRITVAEEADDIVKLAGILNLGGQHFDDLLKDQSLSWDQRLDLMRRRVSRIARIHLSGLGTPGAVMEAAAVFLNANIVPERQGDPAIKHVDPDGFSHKAMLEFSELPDKPREPMYLYESPIRRQKVDPAERWPMEAWSITNHSADIAPVRIVIKGVDDRTVRPSIFCPGSQEGIVFDGVVPGGETLVIDSFEGATLGDEAVDDQVIYFRGAIADFSREGQSVLAVQDEQTRASVPRAPSGPSEWRFKVAEAVYDGSDFDLCALETPPGPIGTWDGDFKFDECIFYYPPGGIAGMAWDESVACTFKLLLPAHFPTAKAPATTGGGQPANPVTRVSAIMNRFRPAGIRAIVDTAKDAWILGSSVLRDDGATQGEGVEFHATRLTNPRTELFVP